MQQLTKQEFHDLTKANIDGCKKKFPTDDRVVAAFALSQYPENPDKNLMVKKQKFSIRIESNINLNLNFYFPITFHL